MSACYQVVWLHAARVFMAMRECLISDRRPEVNEEVVADLHSCLEQLNDRCSDMEVKIARCAESAVYHRKLALRERTQVGQQREMGKARMFLLDRRRLQLDHDRSTKSMHMLRRQIDTLVSSHVDSIILDAMRGYTMTAAKLGLPDKTAEMESLATELSDRNDEVTRLQEAMGSLSDGYGSSLMTMDDDELMLELDTIMNDEPSSPASSFDVNNNATAVVISAATDQGGALFTIPSVPKHAAGGEVLDADIVAAVTSISTTTTTIGNSNANAHPLSSSDLRQRIQVFGGGGGGGGTQMQTPVSASA